MGKFYEEIPEDLIPWIEKQKCFWVATAALSGDGHVNLSPKGYDSFNIVDQRSCWYLDLTGSGVETISHLYEKGNGRITILFNAFEGGPKIARLFGQGKVFEVDTPEFNELLPPGHPSRLPGSRAIIWVDIHKVGTSCGFGVPFYEFKSIRDTLTNWNSKIETNDANGNPEQGLKKYWKVWNSSSIDGIPGLRTKGGQNISRSMKGTGMGGRSGNSVPASLVSFPMGFLVAVLAMWFSGMLSV